MSSIRNLLCAALAVGILFSAPSAEARFGKHSSSSDSSDSKSHKATAVGDDDDDDDDDAPRRRRSGSSSGASFLLDVLFALILDTRPAAAYVAPPPEPVQAEPVASAEVRSTPAQPSPLSARLGVDGAALTTAAGLSAFLGVEGIRAGMDARALGLILPTDDGTGGTDKITLMNFHLTYALLSQERARLRVEGGISSAHAPDLTALGPSIALSFEACLVGNLDLELRAQGTPYPYRQLDAQAGLALHLNALVLRGGWRGLYLSDNGLVDDVVHEEVLGGPFVGLGFAF
ncbi:hypothetical protein [Hyalangium sp.]|uniref:hypothetical protein n=1 Tax=Hyalangium sp. TaxID=2028555 RepID=UPI002D30ED4F|nr:hypothetical protein [Hyalangium sp.]HYI00045.1 hypothetical protein [Hyalangium sp.]